MSATTWRAALDAWTGHLAAARRQPSTIDRYRRRVEQLARAVDAGPWDVTDDQASAWLDGQNWSAYTRAGVLIALRSFYAYGLDQGYLTRSPLAGHGVRRQPGPPQNSPRTEVWRLAIDEYVTWLRAGGRAETTIRLRQRELVAASTELCEPWAVTTADLAAWLSSQDWAPQTRKSHQSTLRTFYRWAVKVGRVDHDPGADLDPVMVHRELPRPIPLDLLRDALATADDRQQMILYLAALAGLRRSEIARVHFRDVMGDQLLVYGKGGHQRYVPLHPQLAAALTRERELRRGGGHGTGWNGPHVAVDGYVFPSQLHPGPITSGQIASLASRCLPDGWTLHTLRHRFATAAYAAQRDLRAVQELLGHSRPETTTIYAAVPDGAKLAAVAGVGIMP